MFFLKRKPAVQGLVAKGPIFVGGDGRSGTTLLSLILDSHSKLAVGPELHFMGPDNLGTSVLEALDLLIRDDPRSRNPELRNHPHLKKPTQFAKRCHRYGVDFETLQALIKQQQGVSKDDLESFASRCGLIEAIGQRRLADTGKAQWGIKIMRDIGRLDRYAKIWPTAKFLHIIRDGRDVAASQMKEHGTWGYASIEEAAKAWVALIKSARAHSRGCEYLEVRYERLVGELPGVVKELCEFLEIDPEDGMLSHESGEHALFENPYNHPSYKQVAAPVNTTAVGRYKTDLTEEQIAAFDKIAAEFL